MTSPIPLDSQLAMFADDTTILTQDSVLNLSIEKLQSSLNEITSWFKKWKLKLNPTKIEVKIFTLKRYNDPINISINNQIIQWNRNDDSVKIPWSFSRWKTDMEYPHKQKTYSGICQDENSLPFRELQINSPSLHRNNQTTDNLCLSCMVRCLYN